MKVKTIVVPTDFSEHADQALHFAIELARHTQSKIILYHNMDVPAGFFGNDLPTAADYTFGTVPINAASMEITPELEKIHNERLHNIADQLRQEFGSTLTVETFSNWGSMNDNLNQLVQDEAADLVVMGTKGTNSFLDRLIGTNTASYVKAAHCPVLVIPGGTQFRSFKHIAYATGLDQDDTIYLRQLLSFAEPFGASVTLINVKSDQQLDIVPDEQLLTDISRNFPNDNIKLVRLHQDNVVKGLETFVQQHNLDLLTVAIHEQNFFASLFHSSISEQLTLHSIIPLLALPQRPYKRSQ
jgi:nucleotide-binding universal stress UspA family protein